MLINKKRMEQCLHASPWRRLDMKLPPYCLDSCLLMQLLCSSHSFSDECYQPINTSFQCTPNGQCGCLWEVPLILCYSLQCFFIRAYANRELDSTAGELSFKLFSKNSKSSQGGIRAGGGRQESPVLTHSNTAIHCPDQSLGSRTAPHRWGPLASAHTFVDSPWKQTCLGSKCFLSETKS